MYDRFDLDWASPILIDSFRIRMHTTLPSFSLLPSLCQSVLLHLAMHCAILYCLLEGLKTGNGGIKSMLRVHLITSRDGRGREPKRCRILIVSLHYEAFGLGRKVGMMDHHCSKPCLLPPHPIYFLLSAGHLQASFTPLTSVAQSRGDIKPDQDVHQLGRPRLYVSEIAY